MENNKKQSDYTVNFYENTIEDLRNVLSKSIPIIEVDEVNRLIQVLEKSHLLLQSCFESPIDEIILSIDNDYNYLYFNDYYKKVMNSAYGIDIHIGMNLLDNITNENDKIRSKKNFGRALNGEYINTVEEYGKIEKNYFETRYSPIKDKNNQVIGATAFSTNVTKRVQTEKALIESENKYQYLVENLPDAISIYSEGKIVYVNKECLRLMAATTEEQLIGKSVIEFVHPDFRKLVAERMKTISSEQSVLSLQEEKFMRLDGLSVDVEVKAIPIVFENKPAVQLVVRDITQRKEVEKVIRENEQKYSLLFKHLSTGFALHEIILNDEGQASDYRFLEVNPAFEQLTGLNSKNLIGKTCLEVLPHTEQNWIDIYANVAFSGESISFENYSVELNRYYQVSTYSPEHGKFATIFVDITDRKTTEKKILESREEFKDLFENAPVGYHEIDINGRIVRMNQTDLKILGYTFEEVKEKYIWELFSQQDLSRNITKDKLKKGVINSIPYERLFIRKDGSKVPVLQMDKILKSAEGKISGIRTSVQDITERYEVEQKLRYYSKFQQLLVNISSSFINLPLDKIETEINTALRNLGLFVGADRSYIFDYDFENQIAINTFEWCDEGIDPQIENLKLVPISEMLDWPKINKKGEGIYIPDVLALKNDSVKEWLEPQGIKSLLTVPMMMDEKCIGFVGFDSVKQHHVYSETEKDLLKVFAQMLVNIQFRKLAEEKLIESEFKYRHITENISDVVWITDLQFNMQFISPSVEKMIGESVEKHIKRTVEEKFTPASVEKLYSLFMEELACDSILYKNRTKIIEVEHYRADGSIFWAEMNVSVIRDENQKPIAIQGVTRDISQRKEAEEAVRESERKYRVLFAENPQPMIIYDIENLSILEVNQTALDFYGYNREEFLSMTVVELHPEKELPTFFESIEKTRKGHNTDGISLHKKKNGEMVYIKITSTSAPIMGSNARHLLLEDITQQKLAEDALMASEDKYRTMINNSNDLIWSVDKEGKFVFMNQMALKTTELNHDDWIGKSFAPLVLPEDLAMMNDIFLRSINGESCSYEFRFKKHDNTILIWHVNTSPIYVSGKIEGVVSFARDITDKKLTELALDKKMKELIHFNDITIGRELKMIELKKEINELLKNAGKPEKYLIVR